MSDWAVTVIEAMGYGGLFALMLLECVFPPIPSEAILPFAGFAVAEGAMSFPLALGAATAGSLAGNLMLYVAARRGGTGLVARHGHRVGAGPARIEQFERWMDRWGSATVLCARAVPLARTAVSLPAGLARFPVKRFIVLTTIGSLAWNAVLIGIGWALDDSWHHVEEVMGPTSIAVVLAMIATGLVVWGVARRRGRREPGSPA
ncbi:MAG TPA: DedA family protein [Miltoncostaeaceae bacterium]|nr:DedA family protein [Miltoncostaeaceae bacterium]